MVKTYLKFLEPLERELSKKIKKKGLTITVSAVSGAGKSDAAKALAKAFKLKYISAGQILRDVAKKRKIALVEFSAIREPEIDHDMDERNLELAIQGNVVLDGRLTSWAAGDWADVKIWIYCSSDVRAKRVAKRDNITVEEARKRIIKRDREDHDKYIKLYGIDSFDTSIYDIKINNGKLTKKQVKTIPVKLVRKFLERN